MLLSVDERSKVFLCRNQSLSNSTVRVIAGKTIDHNPIDLKVTLSTKVKTKFCKYASAEGSRVRRRRKANAASLLPETQEIPWRRNQLTISGAKLLQSPHKLDKLQLLGLWHRLEEFLIWYCYRVFNLPQHGQSSS